MSQTIIKTYNRTVRFYGIGGCGINLLRAHMENAGLNNQDVYADEKYTLLDTGRSNLDGAVDENTYIMKGVDGSGGDRRANALKFKQLLPDILEKHQPADFNVVVFGLGGGSGAAGAPQLVEELVKRGHHVTMVTVGLGAEEALKNISNAVETVTGLQMAIDRLGVPLTMHYTQQDPTKSDLDNNVYPLFAMSALSILYSGGNPRVDRADILNMHDYRKVTPQSPALSLMRITVDEEELRSYGQLTTYIALMKNEQTPAPRVPTDYSKLGLMNQNSEMQRSYYYTVVANLDTVHDDLAELQRISSNRKAVKVESQSLIKENQKADEDTGLFFG